MDLDINGGGILKKRGGGGGVGIAKTKNLFALIYCNLQVQIVRTCTRLLPHQEHNADNAF